MRKNRLDHDTASRLLSGTVHPDDAPPAFVGVAGLLHAAATLPAEVEAQAAAAAVSAMVEAIRAEAPVPIGRKRMIGKLLTAKVAAAAATLALTTGGAAAATGSLPDSIQDAVANAVSHVGIELPRSANEHANVGGQSDDPHGQPADTPAGPEDAGTAGKGATISGMTQDPAMDGQPMGPIVSPWASNHHSQAGVNGGGDDTTEAPEASEAPEAPAVPGAADDHADEALPDEIPAGVDGSAKAAEASGGASTEGTARRP